jgi:plasmid stabilization system protein ParE
MAFRVRVLQQAVQDVDAIVHWIAVERQEPQGAVAWLAAYATMLERLAEQADTLATAPEDRFAEDEVRQILFRTRRGRTYRALFTIMADEAIVLHVRGPGQKLLSGSEIRRPDES